MHESGKQSHEECGKAGAAMTLATGSPACMWPPDYMKFETVSKVTYMLNWRTAFTDHDVEHLDQLLVV